ncbi:MAG: HAD family hydrolase [Candidatus Delongbacteria bacterium]
MAIKTVTVDFWDTIVQYPFTDTIFKMRVDHSFNIFKSYDITYDTAEKLMHSIYGYFEDLWHNKRLTPTAKEMFLFIQNLISLKLRKEHFEELVSYNETLITRDHFDLKPEIAAAIRSVSEKYNIVIISDTGFEPGREIKNSLKRHGLLELFKYCVFSDETGFSKPDKRAFELAAKVSGSDLSEMIHIGDREAKDIVGSRSAGMKSVLYTGFRDDDKNITTADYTAGSWQDVLNILQQV